MASKRTYKLKPGMKPFLLYGTTHIITDKFLETHEDLGKLHHRFAQFRQRVAITMTGEDKPKAPKEVKLPKEIEIAVEKVAEVPENPVEETTEDKDTKDDASKKSKEDKKDKPEKE